MTALLGLSLGLRMALVSVISGADVLVIFRVLGF